MKQLLEAAPGDTAGLREGISAAALPHQPSCSHPLTIVGYIRNLESLGTVPFIGLELDPQLLRPGGKGYGALVGLAGLVRGHRVGRSCRSKHNRQWWDNAAY